MKISSPNFINNEMIPAKYTCDGQNINPALVIEAVPTEAQSLALIFDDPDARIGIYTHWLVWNIQPRTEKIDEDSIPDEAIQGLNSSGQSGYISPCPPNGEHHYIFKLYALDLEINLSPNSGKSELEQAMEGHIIEQAQTIGLYRR